MIDPRKTGAYISKLRREKDWTQLELAEKLHVTPQAVSRWETGDSFPDLGLMVELGKVFKVSVDNLLNGETTPATHERSRWLSLRGAQPPSKATTGEVLTELAQGQPEKVAKMVAEGKADLESVIEAGPLARPSTMDKVVEELQAAQNQTGFKFGMEQIAELAPFISQDLLSEIVDQIVDDKVDLHYLSELAPFLNRETLDGLVDRAVTGEMDGSILAELAPFLSRDKLDGLVEMVKEGTLDESHLEELAPFLSRETLERLVELILGQEIDAHFLSGLAPFLDRETLDKLVERIKAGTFEKEYLGELAPFLSSELLERLLFESTDGKIEIEMLEELAPFLSKETLERLVEQVSEGKIEADHLVAIAPFLTSSQPAEDPAGCGSGHAHAGCDRGAGAVHR